MDIPQITHSDFLTFLGRAKHLYNIRTEDNRIATFVPNTAQEKFQQIRNEEFSRSESIKGVEQCKLLILKGRQVGATTDTGMFNMDIMLQLNNARGIVLAHDDKSTPLIYDKYKIAYRELPQYVQIVNDDGSTRYNSEGEPVIVPIKPGTESFSGYQLEFGEGTRSRIFVRTAGSGDNVGKGDTLNFVHLSEAANYDHFDNVKDSISQQLPKDAYVYSVIESTANGVSGQGEGFYNLWTNSVREWQKFQDGVIPTFEGYRPVFIPWYDMKKYRMPLVQGQLIDITNVKFHDPDKKKAYLEMEEKLIEETFDNREEGKMAVNWYRWCIKENCGYDINVAKRYYPTTPDEAFISSDTGFFDTPSLFTVQQDYSDGNEPEFVKGYIDDNYEFVESSTGDFKIWDKPDDNYVNRYVISIDPSYGIEEGDFSCIMVFDRLKEEFVAKWYGNLKEDLVAEELLRIAYYYNMGLIIPEMNLKTVLNLIEPDGLMPYEGQIYEREVKSRTSVEYGFHTHGGTRKPLLDRYARWLRDDYFKIPDISTLKEHITFVKKVTRGTPKFEASEGNHDDQIIAMALCLEGHEWWDEEIYTLNEEGDDIDKIFEVNKSKSHYWKASKIGTGQRQSGRKRKSNTLKQSKLGI